jgi:hypothetical protein
MAENIHIKNQEIKSLKEKIIDEELLFLHLENNNNLKNLEGLENNVIHKLIIEKCRNLKSIKEIKKVKTQLEISDVDELSFDFENQEINYVFLSNIKKIFFEENKNNYIESFKLSNLHLIDFNNFPFFDYLYAKNCSFENFKLLDNRIYPDFISIENNKKLKSLEGLNNVKGLEILNCDNIEKIKFQNEINAISIDQLNNLKILDLSNAKK